MNQSSESYDLLIMNVTDSDEGLYYCGSEESTVLADEKRISLRSSFRYSNVTTRLLLCSSDSSNSSDSGSCHIVSWMLHLTPAVTVLSSILPFALVYYICQKTANDPPVNQKKRLTRSQTKRNQDEDLCLT
ncbi:hypothetical protein LDENG_00190360 [Lucifuga dentata]|nr:hypothetical protein LDENG_00190360 [Lucifuga dentata]